MGDLVTKKKLYSRKEALQLTGKSIIGIAVAGTIPSILTGCAQDTQSTTSANVVADKDVVFTPKGICCTEMRYSIKDGKITNVEFDGGCNGNLQGIAKLTEGMTPEEAAKKIQGIKCGTGEELKDTSCPDQFSKALLQNI